MPGNVQELWHAIQGRELLNFAQVAEPHANFNRIQSPTEAILPAGKDAKAQEKSVLGEHPHKFTLEALAPVGNAARRIELRFGAENQACHACKGGMRFSTRHHSCTSVPSWPGDPNPRRC